VGGAFGVAVGLGPPHLRFIILWGVAVPMAFERRWVLSPVAPLYLNVTPQWLLEARRRPAEELFEAEVARLAGR